MTQNLSNLRTLASGLGVFLPDAVTDALEPVVSRFRPLLNGEGDPDRPHEQLDEVLTLLQPHASRWHAWFKNGLHLLRKHPRLRGFTKRRVMHAVSRLEVFVAEDSPSATAYLDLVSEPGAFTIACAVAKYPSETTFAWFIQAKALARRTEHASGESRFTQTRNLIRSTFDDYYPKYVNCLAFLEAVRTGRSPTPTGRQASSFGAGVMGVEDSLPQGFKDLVWRDAHHIRNAVAHSRYEYNRFTDRVQLRDNDWKWEGPVAELAAEVRRATMRVTEFMPTLSVRALTLGCRFTEANASWDELDKGTLDPRVFLRSLFWPALNRAAPWLDASSPDWRKRVEAAFSQERNSLGGATVSAAVAPAGK